MYNQKCPSDDETKNKPVEHQKRLEESSNITSALTSKITWGRGAVGVRGGGGWLVRGCL